MTCRCSHVVDGAQGRIRTHHTVGLLFPTQKGCESSCMDDRLSGGLKGQALKLQARTLHPCNTSSWQQPPNSSSAPFPPPKTPTGSVSIRARRKLEGHGNPVLPGSKGVLLLFGTCSGRGKVGAGAACTCSSSALQKPVLHVLSVCPHCWCVCVWMGRSMG
mmetsp:Transcript_53546/g.95491  ORF Transcript_53546/g.95491 Transcript_53546/m.95491 type:complete len:161 (-) Transcript_53546:38-520(-)